MDKYKSVTRSVAALALAAAVSSCASKAAVQLPSGYLGEAESSKILAKTLTIRLAPDLTHLSDARVFIRESLRAAKVMRAPAAIVVPPYVMEETPPSSP